MSMDLELPSIPIAEYKYSTYVLYPSLKPPVVFEGCLILLEEFDIPDNEFDCCYTCYLTKQHDLVLVRSEISFDKEYLDEECSEFIKVRKLRKYCDVWTMFKNCERNVNYIDFLKHVSKRINGTESFFWLPL